MCTKISKFWWLVALIFTVSAFAQPRKAKLTFFIGDVSVKLTAEGQPVLAKLGQELPESAVINTGFESRAEITLEDGGVLRVKERSHIELFKYRDEGGKRQLAIRSNFGSIFAKLKKAAENDQYGVMTPVAVVAIRGTEFSVNVGGDGATDVLCLAGKVLFSSLAGLGDMIVDAGQKSSMFFNQAPSAAIALTNTELNALKSMSEGAGFTPGAPTPEKKEEEKKEEGEGGKGGFNMGMGIGSAIINGQVYNMIGLRPEISFGKLGIGLDLPLYLDAKGNFYKGNWKHASDLLEKIYYLRWGKKGDPFYARLGSLPDVSLGYGILVDHYSNVVEYPSIIRVGTEVGLVIGKYRVDVFTSNIRELGQPGLVGARFGWKFFGPLELGITGVYDGNEYYNFKRRSDMADSSALADLALRNLNQIKNNDKQSVSAFAIDIGWEVMKSKLLGLAVYGQAGGISKYGFGVAAPGVLANFGPIWIKAEYRNFGKEFIYGFFNTTYELERAALVKTGPDSLRGKVTFLKNLPKQQGIFAQAGFNIFNIIVFSFGFQNMKADTMTYRSAIGNLDLNTKFIPKIKQAGLFYYQNNVPKDQFFKNYPGTVYGYRVGYEITQGVMLIATFNTSYRYTDYNTGKFEKFQSTTIQTAFTF